jgi:hypothetical protein
MSPIVRPPVSRASDLESDFDKKENEVEIWN